MQTKLNNMSHENRFLIASAISLCGLLCAVTLSAAEQKKEATAPSNQKEFKTPKEAVESLAKAAESFDVAALKEILGPDAEDIVSSEDPVADKNRATAFA